MDVFVAEIIMELARIHQDLERLRLRLNPIPDLITFASDNVAAQLKQYVRVVPSEEASDTVYVQLQVDSEEEPETKYLNLYVDTRPSIDRNYQKRHEDSDEFGTKVVYLNIDSSSKMRSYPRYSRRRRHIDQS